MDWQNRAKQYFKMAALIYVHYYLLYFISHVLFSDTLTCQQQRHNIATFVNMTTNLSWRRPGVRNVRISCVPTVTGTIPDLHQANTTS